MGWGISLCSLSAHASRAVDEVAQLLEQGKGDQAAKQADSHLKQNPNDVEMRFMRGVMSADQMRSPGAGAIACRTSLQGADHLELLRQAQVIIAAEFGQPATVHFHAHAVTTGDGAARTHTALGKAQLALGVDALLQVGTGHLLVAGCWL